MVICKLHLIQNTLYATFHHHRNSICINNKVDMRNYKWKCGLRWLYTSGPREAGASTGGLTSSFRKSTSTTSDFTRASSVNQCASDLLYISEPLQLHSVPAGKNKHMYNIDRRTILKHIPYSRAHLMLIPNNRNPKGILWLLLLLMHAIRLKGPC